MDVVSVRYITHDVGVAVGFYRDHLGFEVLMQPAPGFAMLSRGNLRLLLTTPAGGGGAGQPMPDGRMPQPGGWNRVQLQWRTCRPRWMRCARQASTFAITSPMAGAVGRSCSTTPPATPSSCSNPHGADPEVAGA